MDTETIPTFGIDLDDPDFLAKLHEVAETAITRKLLRLNRKGTNEVESRVPVVTNEMWLKYHEAVESGRTETTSHELARIAASATSVMFRAEASTTERLEQKAARTDKTRNLYNWEKMTPEAQIALAGRFVNSSDITVDSYRNWLEMGKKDKADEVFHKAQAVLSAHTLMNEPGRGGKVRKWTDPDILVIPAEAAKAVKRHGKGKTLSGDIREGTVDRGSKSRNLGNTFIPRYDARITTTGPIAEIMENSLRASRSAETGFFYSVRSNTLFEAMWHILPLSFFQYENGTNGINYSEAHRVLKGSEPDVTTRMRYMRTIRHQAEAAVDAAKAAEKVLLTPNRDMSDVLPVAYNAVEPITTYEAGRTDPNRPIRVFRDKTDEQREIARNEAIAAWQDASDKADEALELILSAPTGTDLAELAKMREAASSARSAAIDKFWTNA